MTNFIIHHNDPDGYMSAAIVFEYIKQTCSDAIVTMAWDYKNPFPDYLFNKHDTVWVVDINKDLREYKDKCLTLYHIDHHKADYYGDNYDVLGVRSTDKAACELVWEYFYSSKECPKAVQLIGDYDTWKFKHFESKAFQLAIRRMEQDVFKYIELLYSAKLGDMYIEGQREQEIIDRKNKEFFDQFAFEVILYDAEDNMHRCVCLNKLGGSLSFPKDWKEKFPEADILITFVMFVQGNTIHYRTSFYSEGSGPDVCAIAKIHGGGGHLHAAGCVTDYIPFTIP